MKQFYHQVLFKKNEIKTEKEHKILQISDPYLENQKEDIKKQVLYDASSSRTTK
jgi:hypothetical protein